jgi:hypothetical protein
MACDFKECLTNLKYRTLSVAFTLIGALTLVAAFGFYINTYIQPSRTSINPALLVDSFGGTATATGNLSDGTAAATESDGGQGQMNASGQTDSGALPSSNASSTLLLTADTFARPSYGAGFSSSTQKAHNIITEYIIRATSTPGAVSSSGKTGTSTGASSSPSSASLRTDLLSEKVTSSALGITFIKDPFWKQTTSGTAVTLTQVGPEARDVIYMKRFYGASVATEDSANGNVMYFYDAKKSSWMKAEYSGQTLNQSGGGTKGIPVAFVPTHFTKGGKPIFEGTNQTRTLIIALDTADFIIVNISGTGYAGILDYFVDGITPSAPY